MERDLTRAVTNEGRRLQSYLEFDTRVSLMNRNLQSINTINTTAPDDAAFWLAVEGSHGLLMELVCIDLRNFDASRFQRYHQGLLIATQQQLEARMMEASTLSEQQLRPEYIRCLGHALAAAGSIRGFGRLILETTSKAMVDFGGA